ncbi:hypothetical protein D3C75_637530 [compost metagenome]
MQAAFELFEEYRLAASDTDQNDVQALAGAAGADAGLQGDDPRACALAIVLGGVRHMAGAVLVGVLQPQVGAQFGNRRGLGWLRMTEQQIGARVVDKIQQ